MAQQSWIKLWSERRVAILGIGLALAIAALYILRSRVLFLADGYIFLAYARNISEHFSWSINPPEVTFATSSPLWTLLCAALAFLTPREWLVPTAQLVGVSLFCCAIAMFDAILRRLRVHISVRMAIVCGYATFAFGGFFYIISAMETSLFILLLVAISLLIVSRSESKHGSLVGVLGGLLYLTRVEGVFVLPAYLIAEMGRGAGMRAAIERSAAAAGSFALIAAPWQLFLLLKSGSAMPTSGPARLYLYFPDIIHRPMSEYLSLSWFERACLLPKIFYGNFILHPVVLLSCFAPLVGMSLLYFWILRQKRSSEENILISFLVIFNWSNFIIYFLFQPLIFQRYLVASLPSFLLMVGLATRLGQWRPADQLRSGLLLAGAASLVLGSHLVGVKYFDKPTRRDAKIIEIFRKLDASTGGKCRVAVEPLGLAAFHTRCYVIDLGGLINPDIWPLLLHGTNRNLELRYAKERRATHIYFSDLEGIEGLDLAFKTESTQAIYAIRY